MLRKIYPGLEAHATCICIGLGAALFARWSTGHRKPHGPSADSTSSSAASATWQSKQLHKVPRFSPLNLTYHRRPGSACTDRAADFTSSRQPWRASRPGCTCSLRWPPPWGQGSSIFPTSSRLSEHACRGRPPVKPKILVLRALRRIRLSRLQEDMMGCSHQR